MKRILSIIFTFTFGCFIVFSLLSPLFFSYTSAQSNPYSLNYLEKPWILVDLTSPDRLILTLPNGQVLPY